MYLVSDLIDVIQPLSVIGQGPEHFRRVAEWNAANTEADVVMWIAPKNIDKLSEVRCGIIICPELPAGHPLPDGPMYLQVPSPRSAFAKVMKHFFASPKETGIHPTAIIHPTATIGNGCSVGAYVVIEADCSIGDDVSVGHHTVLARGTVLEDHVTIGMHCSIGSDGFGFEKDEEGHFQLIPHLGKVVIRQYADIGNNVCIDRGTLGDTIIGPHVHIDNLVHIAHNVQIGEGTLIIAHAQVAGSCKIGEDVWIAPCASILNKVTIGNNAFIGLGAVVFRDVNEKEMVVGNPARVTLAKS